jgi:hypothetical protein
MVMEHIELCPENGKAQQITFRLPTAFPVTLPAPAYSPANEQTGIVCHSNGIAYKPLNGRCADPLLASSSQRPSALTQSTQSTRTTGAPTPRPHSNHDGWRAAGNALGAFAVGFAEGMASYSASTQTFPVYALPGYPPSRPSPVGQATPSSTAISRPTYSTFSPSGPPQLVGADGRYLGVLSSNQFDPNSVSNPFGRYGSEFSPDSINDPFGKYGSQFSPYSATNPFATKPPVIVNPYLGRLSANPYLPNSTSNEFGPYGSQFSPTSINNPFSPYGNSFSPSSVNNPFATSPVR